jgi:hypothetical protein
VEEEDCLPRSARSARLATRLAAARPPCPLVVKKEEVVTREYTINLHKRLHGWYLFSISPPCFLYCALEGMRIVCKHSNF